MSAIRITTKNFKSKEVTGTLEKHIFKRLKNTLKISKN